MYVKIDEVFAIMNPKIYFQSFHWNIILFYLFPIQVTHKVKCKLDVSGFELVTPRFSVCIVNHLATISLNCLSIYIYIFIICNIILLKIPNMKLFQLVIYCFSKGNYHYNIVSFTANKLAKLCLCCIFSYLLSLEFLFFTLYQKFLFKYKTFSYKIFFINYD